VDVGEEVRTDDVGGCRFDDHLLVVGVGVGFVGTDERGADVGSLVAVGEPEDRIGRSPLTVAPLVRCRRGASA